jgi:hypothetical protein
MSLPRWKYGVAVASVAVTFGGMAVAGALPGLPNASGPTVKIVRASVEPTTTTTGGSTTTADPSTTTTIQEESTTTAGAPVVGSVTVTCVDDDHAKIKPKSDDHDADDKAPTSTSTTSTTTTTTSQPTTMNPAVPRHHDCDDQNEHEVERDGAKDTRPVVSGNSIVGNSGQRGGDEHNGGGRD